jgi:hypothetical protein
LLERICRLRPFVSQEKQFQYHPGKSLAPLSKLPIISRLRGRAATATGLLAPSKNFWTRKIFRKPLGRGLFWCRYYKDHVVFVDVNIAHFERAALVSEDSESKRSIEALGGRLLIANREDDLLESRE